MNTKNESHYFMQGGEEQCNSNLIEKLNRTLTLRIRNASATLTQSALVFAADREPIVQPLGVTVTVEELNGIMPSTHNYLRRDLLVKNIAFKGLKVIVNNNAQFANQLIFQRIAPTGKLLQYIFQPSNFLSPTNLSGTVIDVTDFGLIADGRAEVQV